MLDRFSLVKLDKTRQNSAKLGLTRKPLKSALEIDETLESWPTRCQKGSVLILEKKLRKFAIKNNQNYQPTLYTDRLLFPASKRKKTISNRFHSADEDWGEARDLFFFFGGLAIKKKFSCLSLIDCRRGFARPPRPKTTENS